MSGTVEVGIFATGLGYGLVQPYVRRSDLYTHHHGRSTGHCPSKHSCSNMFKYSKYNVGVFLYKTTITMCFKLLYINFYYKTRKNHSNQLIN